MRLSEFDFEDLILSERRAWVRTSESNESAYQRAPDSLEDDIGMMFTRVKEEEMRAHDREFSVTHDGFVYRVSVMISERGKNYVLRKGLSTVIDVDKLTIKAALTNRFLDPNITSGLILIVGSQGNGKTTTASAILRSRVSRFKQYAVTIEDPPEQPLEGDYEGGGLIFQTRVNKVHSDDAIISQWNIAIEYAMRYGKPDMLFLGEIRNSAAASQSIRAASSGVLVIATMHAASVLDAIQQMVSWVSETEGAMGAGRVADALRVVMHQTLTPKPNRTIKAEVLMVDENPEAIRSRIRAGQIAQLGSEIQAQANRMMLQGRGIDPLNRSS